MSQTEQAAQVAELRRQAILGNIETLTALIGGLSNDVIKQRQHIIELGQRLKELETCATLNTEMIGQVEQLKVTLVEQGMRIEKLEAALREVAPWLA